MKRLHNKGFSAIEIIIVIAIVCAIGYAGWYAYGKTHKTSASSTARTSDVLSKPTIPAIGAYLGAWVNPNNPTSAKTPGSQSLSKEIAQLPSFNQAIGKHVAILHIYTPLKDGFPLASVNAVSQNGSIPLIDLSCSSISHLTGGQEDSTLATYAQAAKSYAKPIFLRWYWEMNLDDSGNKACGGYNNGTAYIAAWRHIWSIFNAAGASNVAFVWCPSVQSDASQYYPGDKYVDWISVDGYDRQHQGISAFTDVFSKFYKQWVGSAKPIMVAETGATSPDQAQYIQGIAQTLPNQFPQIKALVYFDAVGPAADWGLHGDGVTAFSNLAKSSYFSFTGQ
jgi:prepilin-type N-terminal cleavage/methylation domain-containing protein